MSDFYRLTYFDVRGRAEPIRMLLSYVGADWRDKRIPFKGIGMTPIPQEVKSKCLYGQVPLLEFGGERLNQSMTILRFLGRKYDLAGKDDLESAHVDAIGDVATDILTTFSPVFGERDGEKKKEFVKSAVATVKDKYLTKLNELAEKNGGYLVTTSLTWADITVASTLSDLQLLIGTSLVEDLPALQKFMDNVFSAKGIKEWIAARPDTPF